MKKRFKGKRRKKSKSLIYILILICLVYFEFYISKYKLNYSNEILLNNMLNSATTSYNLNENTIYKKTRSSFKNIFNSPEYILTLQLKYTMNKDEKVSFIYGENELPLVYIYNSHQGEEYSNKYLEDYNIVPNVITASYMLEEKLENIDINTLVEENDILSYMKNNSYDHSKSYIASRYFLINVMKKYRSIKLYIDLHRDSVTHDVTTINIDGKDYARLLFVIGLKYETYEQNLSIAEYLNNKLDENYKGLSRGILKKSNAGANGVYNQDLSPNIILIEVGGVDNNIDEINNTLDILSKVIGDYINEED